MNLKSKTGGTPLVNGLHSLTLTTVSDSVSFTWIQQRGHRMAAHKRGPAPIQEWAQRTEARLVDRDAWPIHKAAEVSCLRKGRYARGVVIDTYLDHNQRPVVEVRTDIGVRCFRPADCRVQRKRGKKI